MGSYILELADDVMAEAQKAAAEENVSLAELLSALIKDGIVRRTQLKWLNARAARGNVEAALVILNKVPSISPKTWVRAKSVVTRECSRNPRQSIAIYLRVG